MDSEVWNCSPTNIRTCVQWREEEPADPEAQQSARHAPIVRVCPISHNGPYGPPRGYMTAPDSFMAAIWSQS